MEIVWSLTANYNNLENIEYLIKEWSLNVVLDYEKKVLEVEKLLKSNPNLGSFDSFLNLNKILIVPQIYLLYEISGNEIHIIDIWNNHKKPYW